MIEDGHLVAIGVLTEPFVLDDGQLRVPTGPGLGVSPIPEVLEDLTTSTEQLVR